MIIFKAVKFFLIILMPLFLNGKLQISRKLQRWRQKVTEVALTWFDELCHLKGLVYT